MAIGAGAVVGLVGSRGENRRATTWIGVIAVFGGCVAVITDIAPSNAAVNWSGRASLIPSAS